MDSSDKWILALGFILLPSVFVVVGGFLLRGARRFMRNAIRVDGTVLHVEQNYSTSGSGSNRSTSRTYKPTFQYTDPDGNNRQASTFLSSSAYNYAVGQTRPILVSPDKPEQCRMPGFWIYGFGAIFMGFGLVFMGIGLAILLTAEG